MLVSHFELLFKPQSPAAPIGTGPVDRVVQGYFLEITNLESITLEYLVEFVLSPPDPSLPERSLAGNTLIIVDTPPGTDNRFGTLLGSLSSSIFRPDFAPPGPTRRIVIPPSGTALVALLPSIFASPLDPTPLNQPIFEARGYVNLRLPAIRKGSFFPTAQSDGPVEVMLTPQSRATFFLADGSISDQVQAGLPLAGGSAVGLVDAEQGFPFPFPLDVALDRERIAELAERLDITSDERIDLLAGLLAEVSAQDSDLTGLNDALQEAGIAVTVTRSGRHG